MATNVQTTDEQPEVYEPQKEYPPQPQQTSDTDNEVPVRVIASHASGASPKVRYNTKAGLFTGVLQVGAGVILVASGIIALVFGSFYNFGWSIWGSICLYIVTGIFGIVSQTYNRRGVIIVYMVMCITSSLCAGGQMIYDAAAAGNTFFLSYEYCGFTYDNESRCSRAKVILAMHFLSAIIALCEMLTAIVGSAYCCHGCYSDDTPNIHPPVVSYAEDDML